MHRKVGEVPEGLDRKGYVEVYGPCYRLAHVERLEAGQEFEVVLDGVRVAMEQSSPVGRRQGGPIRQRPVGRGYSIVDVGAQAGGHLGQQGPVGGILDLEDRAFMRSPPDAADVKRDWPLSQELLYLCLDCACDHRRPPSRLLSFPFLQR